MGWVIRMMKGDVVGESQLESHERITRYSGLGVKQNQRKPNGATGSLLLHIGRCLFEIVTFFLYVGVYGRGCWLLVPESELVSKIKSETNSEIDSNSG